ncbi:MAG: PDZ domain-containing protein [Deltaproteobacteria bacterium]|nr:PDZ domain-containing protein [Deltaproteobacteria bacterium]
MSGTGFIEGPTRIRFEGAFEPIGLAEPKSHTAYLDGTAVSGTLIEIPINSRVMKQLTDEPARFKGSVEVTFPAASALDAIRIVARNEHIEIDLRPAGGGVAIAARRFREANHLLASLGIALTGDDGKDNLVIAEIIPGSPAAAAGVEPGDRILAVDGTALAAPADLAGVSEGDSHRFELVSGEGTMREVVLAVGSPMQLDSDEFTAIVLSSIALGLFLAFAAPTRRRTAMPYTRTTDPFTKAIGFAAVSVPLILIPAGAMLSHAEFGAAIALIGVNVLGLAGIALFTTGKALKRFAAFLAHLLPVPAIMAVAGASGSAIGLWDIVASQEATPWGWHAWSSPFALGLVIAAVALLWPSTAGNSENKQASTFAAWTASAPGAALIAAYCLGGWIIPGIPVNRMTDSSLLLIAGCLIFFTKTWIVLLVARGFAAASVVERRTMRTKIHLGLRFVALGVAAVLALGWLWTDIPTSCRIAGQMLATATSITLFTAGVIVMLKKARQSFGNA